MADLPSDLSGHRARLRQRLFEGGGKALLDHELVEYLIALAIPRRDTKSQARALIARFGGIGPLLSADAGTLRREGLSDGVIGALKIAQASALRLLESPWDPIAELLPMRGEARAQLTIDQPTARSITLDGALDPHAFWPHADTIGSSRWPGTRGGPRRSA